MVIPYIYNIDIYSSRVKNLIGQKRKIEMTLCHKKYLKREMTPCYNNILNKWQVKFICYHSTFVKF